MPALLLILLATTIAGCSPARAVPPQAPAPMPSGWTLDRQPVPATLDQALDALMRGLGAGTIAYLRASEEDVAIRLVPTLGRWIQEHWGLWHGGPLYRHLAALGLERTDDMAAVILTSFWRRLHFREMRVEEQVRWYTER